MTVVQQILYTDQQQRWWALAEALGLTLPYPPNEEWTEFHGDGILAVHRAFAERPAGAIDIHVLVDDLDAADSALSGFDVHRGRMEGIGEILTVRAGSGVEITVGGGAEKTPGGVAVQPIWFQRDLAEPRAILEALGMRAGIASDAGSWTEMRADGGAIGLHAGDALLGPSFETRGDIDVLVMRLREAGFEAAVVDEAYTRTIRVPDPDGGAEIVINAAQEDLHGYHREDAFALDLGEGFVLALRTPELARHLVPVIAANLDRLRPWEPWTHTFDPDPVNDEYDREQIRRFEEGTAIPLVLLRGDAPMGSFSAQIDRYTDTATIGFWVVGEAEGSGIASRACSALIAYLFADGLERIEIRTASHNERSIRLAQRLGFEREGTLRSAFPVGGARHDLAVFGLLRG